MDKLLELEEKLKLAKTELSKIMSASTTAPGSVNSTGGSSLASQIGFGKAEEEEKKKKEKHEDEKEDKKLIADAIDQHNEKKHGEPKDENSAQKDMGLEKGLPGNKFGNQVQQDRESSMHAARKPAVSIDPKTGAKTVIDPKDQVKAQADAKAATKAKNEAAAAERRAQMKAEAKKPEEVIKFDKNGQWSMGSKDC